MHDTLTCPLPAKHLSVFGCAKRCLHCHEHTVHCIDGYENYGPLYRNG
jgi:hypothetical protein